MIKFIPHYMKVRNGESGEFIDNLAIKGAPGDIDNLGSYATNILPENSEDASDQLVFTQKGVALFRDTVSETYATKDEVSETYATKDDVTNTYATKKALTAGTLVPALAQAAYTAQSAEFATADGNGDIITDTYATNSQVNGTTLTTSLLAKALELDAGVYHYHLSGATYTGNDLPEINTRYTTATVYVRSKAASIGVVLHGCAVCPSYYNGYSSNSGTWSGWRKFIDSNNIGSQTVSGITCLIGTDQVSRHVWFSQSEEETKRAYSDNFKYDPYTDTLTVGKVSGTANKALKDGNGNTISESYIKKVAFSSSYPDKIILYYGDDGEVQVTMPFANSSTGVHGYIKGTTAGDITVNSGVVTVNKATKATQDGSGNNIVNTYATKASLTEGTLVPVNAQFVPVNLEIVIKRGDTVTSDVTYNITYYQNGKKISTTAGASFSNSNLNSVTVEITADLGSYITIGNNFGAFSYSEADMPLVSKSVQGTFSLTYVDSFIIIGGGTCELTVTAKG